MFPSSPVDSWTDLFTEKAEVSPLLTALPLKDFKDECEDCSELAKLWQVIRSGWLKVKKCLPSEVQLHLLVRHELAVEFPLIFHGTGLVVPKSLQESTIHLAHEGHQGVVCMKQPQRALLVATHG